MDDFKDLVWNGSSTSAPNSTSSAAKPGSSYDPFSMLAASSTAPNRGTPNYLSSTSGPLSRTLTPSNNVAKPPQSSTSGDAFSGLLSFGGSSGTGATMSIAERQAQAERKRREEEERKAQEAKVHGAFWDKFDSGGTLGGSGSSSSGATLQARTSANGPSVLLPLPARSTSTGPVNGSLGGILQPSSRPISPAVKPTSSPKPPSAATPQPPQGKSSLTVWDFDLLGTSNTSAPPSAVQPATNQTDDILGEFDVFAQQPPAASKGANASASVPQRSDSPGDFDWGDREDRDERNGAEKYSGDEDDVLGLLSKPVDQVRPKAESAAPTNGRTQSTSPRPPPSASRAPRGSSPPPHVLGKLVEMGFSIQQARVALAATDTGTDVEAAMEILLAQAAVKDEDERDMQQAPRSEEAEREREEAERRRRQQARRQGPSRANVPAAANGDGPAQRRRVSGNQEGDAESPAPLGQLADHADKVLTQASEIGANLLGKANAFWKSANKAYEDRVKSATPPAPGGSSRPKWMTDAVEHEEPEPATRRERQPKKRPSFVDDEGDGHHEDPVLPPRPKPSGSQRPEGSARPPAAQRDVPTASLFAPAGDAPKSYVSPHRRKAQQPIPSAAPPAPAKPTAPARPARRYVTCSASMLSESSSHRTAGTAAYKLGQFANAEQSFSQAISVLPEKHMGLVPLWNNRAMSRLKTGDGSGAVSDCTAVLELVGTDWKVGDDAADAGGANGAGVDLGEALVKAMTRRAQAYEMNEKWDKAKEDWEKLAGIGNTWGPAGAKAKTEAFRGLDRCRKALAPPPPPAQSTSAASKAKATPRPRPAAPSSGPSEASARLQAANRAAEADEAERYRLKDSVEARLASWKGGKENNIRALVASLENVLWPELNWVKVGMHELITEQQVKIRYMKAIAKVHPDKLRNATVEHQMIANGVFGALNDAYNVFKPA
ncbi:hypothetical protein FRC04_004029 [Tulasnella sp. 424]|nr:hypothetical protein FRC04_004029 [Tulasnella sp. 424]